jgi:hypothetical protein
MRSSGSNGPLWNQRSSRAYGSGVRASARLGRTGDGSLSLREYLASFVTIPGLVSLLMLAVCRGADDRDASRS